MNKKLFSLISIFILSIFFKPVFSNDQLVDSESLKNNLIEKRLLINSYNNCEEYINKSSVELFLNCKVKLPKTEKKMKDN